MKKLISILAGLFVLLSFGMVCAEEISALPFDGLALWSEAVSSSFELDGEKINKWEDKSGNENHLTQTVVNSRPVFTEGAEGIISGNSISFSANHYLIVKDTDYIGDASFILYLKPKISKDGQTVFSSYSHKGSKVTESGKVPFTISEKVSDGESTLVFKMASSNPEVDDFEADMNVSFLKENGELKDYLCFYVTINGKDVSVYYTDTSIQTDITETVATFTLNEVPYWESFAYGLAFDKRMPIYGMQADVAETLIYKKTLSLDEINVINKYLKIKHDYPVIRKLKLKEYITEISKGEITTPEFLGSGIVMGNEVDVDVSGVTLTSSNPEVVIIAGGNSLKALNFGTCTITASYDGIEDFTFSVTVPQLTSEAAQLGAYSAGEKLTASKIVTNHNTEIPLSAMAVTAIYKGNALVDICFEEKENITDEYTFSTELNLPDNLENCTFWMMIVNPETTEPMVDNDVIDIG